MILAADGLAFGTAAAVVIDHDRVVFLRSWTVATAPSASDKGAGAQIFVSNGANGEPVPGLQRRLGLAPGGRSLAHRGVLRRILPMAKRISVVRERHLAEVTLAWDHDGTFKGGHAIWWEAVRVAATGELLSARAGLAEPVAGALQPGTALAGILDDTQAEFIATVSALRPERDALEQACHDLRAEVAGHQARVASLTAERDRLRGQVETLRSERNAARAERDAARQQLDQLRAEHDAPAAKPRPQRGAGDVVRRRQSG